MSSVLKTFERFTIQQELQEQSDDTPVPLETIKPTIRVFVINNNDPVVRSRLLFFNLRIIMSNTAREGHRAGALLSLLSLPSAAMSNHIKLAMHSPEASIDRVEITGFENNSFRVIPDARSTMSRGEVLAFEALAEDIPDTLNHQTPFVNNDVEDDIFDETEKFLDVCYSVLMQAWIVTCKCMTAPDQPPVSVAKRMAKYQQQGRINARYVLQPEAQRLIQNAIRKSMVVRHFMTYELQLSQSRSLLANRYYAMVGDIGKYIEHSGMGGFFLTLKYGLGTRWPTLALAAFSGELQKLKALMLHYQSLGPMAKYMALLESPKLMDFVPSEYPLVYSYAMGIGTVLDTNMRNYAYGRSYLNPQYFQLGVETARKQQGAVDNRTAEDLGMTAADKADLTATISKLSLSQLPRGRQPISDPFAGANDREMGGQANDTPVYNFNPINTRRYDNYDSDGEDRIDNDQDQAIRENRGEPGQPNNQTSDNQQRFNPPIPQRTSGMSSEEFQHSMNQYIRAMHEQYRGSQDDDANDATDGNDISLELVGDFDS
nr:nucleoprotein [Human orthorubulavirus 2]